MHSDRTMEKRIHEVAKIQKRADRKYGKLENYNAQFFRLK